MRLTDAPEEADLVVLNTCHIREKATEKVYSELGRMRDAEARAPRRRRRRMTIAVAGCVAQAEGEEIMRRQPAVDLVVGPQAYHQPARAYRPRPPRPRRTPGRRLRRREQVRRPAGTAARATGVTAFLTVQEGCDKFCTFCVVPYTRGAEYSRPGRRDPGRSPRTGRRGRARGHAARPERQRLSGGPDGAPGLARLIRALAEIPGLDRIRYTTSHPRDMDDDLIAAHGEVPQLMPYLHLPVQSGSDKMLEAMNRGHTADDYLRLIEQIARRAARHRPLRRLHRRLPGRERRRLRGDPAPGRAGGLRLAFSFKYSRRPGTPAAAMPGQVRRGGEGRAARPPAGPARRAAARVQRRHGRPHRRRCCSSEPAASPASSSAAAPSCRRSTPRRRPR